MSAYQALPADGRDIAWAHVDATSDTDHHESVSLRWDNEAWTVTGTMPGADVEFVSRVSPLWHARQFLLFRDMSEPDLWLGTDGHGRWGEMNGAHRRDLDGASDVAIADSIIGLALPLQRLALPVGDVARVLVTLVDSESLAANPELLTYQRLDSHRWSVRSSNAIGVGATGDRGDGEANGGGRSPRSSPIAFDISGPDVLEFDVDDHGLPIDIAGRFRRVASE